MARTSSSQCNLNAEPKRANRQLQYLSGVPKYRLVTFHLATFLGWTRADSTLGQPPMSALGQKQTFNDGCAMSALPPKADIGTQSWNVRFVPKADILRCGKEHRYSITSSARASSAGGISRPMVLAVFRLRTRSNLVGCTTGRSAGLSPLRMRAT